LRPAGEIVKERAASVIAPAAAAAAAKPPVNVQPLQEIFTLSGSDDEEVKQLHIYLVPTP
jgi:hypothetical protein